jgi:hypothetical protein
MSTGRYRLGPWPGLTTRGAVVLLGCALVMGFGLAMLGSPRRPLPDLPLWALVSLVPLGVAVRITRMPGAASAVCGAYLLPRTLLSLVVPGLEPPPLLLVPAVAFDLALFVRAADFAALLEVWPRRAKQRWRKRKAPTRTIEAWRAAAAGAVYGALLSAIVPPWALLLGAEPAVWSSDDALLAALSAVAVGAAVGLIGRDTGS